MVDGLRGKLMAENKFSLLERYALMRFHPRKIILDLIGIIWATYFLYVGIWQAAVITIFIFVVLGFFLVRNIDLKMMAETTWGRLAIMHVHPLNVAIKIFAVIILVNGIYRHSVEHILMGITLIFLGHFFGWAKVHPVFDGPKK
jgi:uncharacterized membrane protein